MGVESGINSMQEAVIRRTFGGSKFAQTMCAVGIGIADIGGATLSKFDRSLPPATNRVDRIIRDACQKAKDVGRPNDGKMAIVTGANCGIGFEIAKAIGRAGFHTILACRSVERGQEALEKLERQTGLEDRYEVQELDLASLASVDRFVSRFKERGCPLHILVNNAGVTCYYNTTDDGIERMFGVNHIGHFALTMGLLDCLKQVDRGHARIVVVGSMGAFNIAKLDYEALESRQKFSAMRNYSISKLANMTFAAALARKLERTKVTVTVVHPGAVNSSLPRNGVTNKIGKSVLRALFVDPITGAVTPVYAALSPDLEGESGTFYSHCLIMNMHPSALDKEEQDKLWEYTEALIAEKTGTELLH